VTPSPSPSPTGPTGMVQATVYYDENGNGQLDPTEDVRLPNVSVSIGSATAKTQSGTGIALVQGIPYGAQTVTVQTGSLPPYWQPANPVTISVPDQGEVRIPVTLPTGRDLVLKQYVAFGDSITHGDGSSSGTGYPPLLEVSLRGSMGAAWVANRGASGTTSAEGAERIKRAMDTYKPSHVLVLYGTNDWNFPQCQSPLASSCFTIESLREIIVFIKSRGSLTYLSTLPPVSVNLDRNPWIEQMNTLIKGLGQEQGVPVVDTYAAFRSAGTLTTLYYDDVHPNDSGYQVLAQTFARALTTGRTASTTAYTGDDMAFGFTDPAEPLETR